MSAISPLLLLGLFFASIAHAQEPVKDLPPRHPGIHRHLDHPRRRFPHRRSEQKRLLGQRHPDQGHQHIRPPSRSPPCLPRRSLRPRPFRPPRCRRQAPGSHRYHRKGHCLGRRKPPEAPPRRPDHHLQHLGPRIRAACPHPSPPARNRSRKESPLQKPDPGADQPRRSLRGHQRRLGLPRCLRRFYLTETHRYHHLLQLRHRPSLHA